MKSGSTFSNNLGSAALGRGLLSQGGRSVRPVKNRGRGKKNQHVFFITLPTQSSVAD